jgi:hypothetical protein
MTVYVHKNNRAVGYGDHFHEAPAKIPGRTWTFECTPECEERVLADTEHSGRNEASVPLTVEETAEEEQLSQTAKKDVTKMAMALSELANQGAKAAD